MKPTIINLDSERASRRKASMSKLDDVLFDLRALPIPERGEVLVAIFSMVNSEFARMLLEHAAPRRRAQRYLGRVKKRSDDIQTIVHAMHPPSKPKGRGKR